MPRISVVIPSLDQAPFIEAALQSLLEQDYPDLEIIVMDGGSTDGTVDILERFAPNLAWWRSAPDGGQSQAINDGFRHATGEILGWLCADDLLAPGSLHDVAGAFSGDRADIVVGRAEVVTARGTRMPWERLRWCNGRDMLLTGCTWSQPATFWRRGLWESVGGLDEGLHYAMDYDLWLRFWERGPRVRYLDRVLAFERRHGAQKTAATNYDAVRTEKLAVRLGAARRRGYSRSGFVLRSLVYRRVISLVRCTRSFFRPDGEGMRWYGAALGFDRSGSLSDGLRLARRWLAVLYNSDADERLLLRVLRRARP